MADEVKDARTGEAVDVSALSDRQLMEAVYRQNNDIVAALIDTLKAVGGVQGTVSEVLKAAKGEDKPKDGKSMKDVAEELNGSIQELVSAVREVPERTGEVVEGRFEDTLTRAFQAASPASETVQ